MTHRIALAVIFTSLLVTLTAAVPLPAGGQPQGSKEAQPAAPGAGGPMSEGHAAFEREDWPAAVQHYEAALKAGQDTPLLHFRLGYALHTLKRYKEALPHHKLATRVTNPALRIDALYNVACAAALLGDKEEALRFLGQAIDAGFKDTAQVAKDTDLDSLRDDPAFKALIDSIGKGPRFAARFDFMVGTWAAKDAEGHMIETLTLMRPMPGNGPLVTASTNMGGGAWTGLIIPNPESKTWRWISADATGTTVEFVGKPIEPAGICFNGRQPSGNGGEVHVRLTFTPTEKGYTQKGETSEDGKTWQVHHEDAFVKVVPSAAPSSPPAKP